MITKEAALDDLEKIDANAPVGKVIVEVGRILIKILATIRSNQLLTDADKVKIREERAKKDTERGDRKAQ
jgi:chaperonin cofactor prefoldin